MSFAHTWSRRTFLGTTAAGLAAQQRRPRNVLLFFSDQESALLPGPAQLPNRDRLRSRGFEFTHAFCNTPQCSPARAALLTGREPHRAGVLTNVDGGSLGKPLDPSLENLGSAFRRQGYRTGYFGKWHLGGEQGGLSRFGFDASDTGSPDAQTATNAAEWIRSRQEPWLACVSLLDPHHIYDAPRHIDTAIRSGVKPPASGLDDLKGKPPEQRWFVDNDQGKATAAFTPEDWIRYRSYYLTLVENVDRLLGQVLAATPFDSTIVAYTSDHGDQLGEHGLPFKGPFLYEELVRIPYLLSIPGVRPHRRDDFATQADLLPTLAALAGIELKAPVSGVNLLGERPARSEVFLEYYAKQKYVNPIRCVRGKRWKMNWYDSGHKELYDLERDPHEKNNLAGETGVRETQSHLEKQLNAWRGPLTHPAA